MPGPNETSIIISAVDRTEGALKSVQNNLGQLEGKFGRLTGVVSGFAALAGVTAFGGIIKGAIDSAAGLHDMSQQTGATVESLSAMKGIAKVAGVELEAVAGGLTKLSKNMLDAAAGSGDASKVFNALGISVTDTNGKMKTSDTVMLEFAKGLQTVSSGAERAAAAQLVLGKSGAQMMPMLNDLALVGELQAKVTAEQAAAADELGDTLTKLSAVHRSWVTTVAMDSLPAANAFTSALLEMAISSNGTKKAVQDLSRDGAIKAWAIDAARAAGFVVDAMDGAVRVTKLVGVSIAGVAKDIETVVKVATIALGAGFTEEGQDAIKAALRERQAFVAALNDDLANILDKPQFSDLLNQKIAALGQDAPKAAEGVKSLAGALAKTSDEAKKAAAALEALRLDQMALLHKQATAELDAMAKAQAEYGKNVAALIDPLNHQAYELERQVEFYGMTEQAIQDTIIARLEEARALAAANGAWQEHLNVLDQEIAARKRIASAAGQKEYLDANKRASEEAARQWENFARDIERSLTDSLFRAFEAGQSFGEAFANSLKNTFKTMALKVAVQAVVGTGGSLLNAGLNALVGSSGSNGGAGNNYFGLANNASSLYNLWGAASALGGGTVGASSASLLYANAVGAAGGDSLGALIAANGGWSGVSAGTAAGSGAAASGAGTGSTAGAMASMWPLAIVAGMMMANDLYSAGYKYDSSAFDTGDYRSWSQLGNEAQYQAANTIGGLFGNDDFGDSRFFQVASGINLSRYVDEMVQKALGIRGGGPKMEAYGGDRDVAWGLAKTAPTNDVLTGIATGLETQFNDLVEKFGQTAMDIVVGLGMDADPMGDAKARMGYSLNVGGTSVFSERDVDAITMEGIQNNANRALIAALQAVDISEPVNTYLDSLGDVSILTKEQIANALGLIDAYYGLNKAMADMNLGANSLTSGMLNAFGGVDGLKTALASYYDGYFSAEEKAADLRGQLATQFEALNLAMPTTRDGFRALVEQIGQAGDASGQTLAALIKISAAFGEVADAAAAAAEASRGGVTNALAGIQKSITGMHQAAADAATGVADSRAGILEAYLGAQDKVATAQETLAGLMQQSADATQAFGSTLTDFIGGLKTGANSTMGLESRYRSLGAELQSTAVLAQAGDQGSRDKLTGIASAYLDAARERSRTAIDYARDESRVRVMLQGIVSSLPDVSATATPSLETQIAAAQTALAAAQADALEYQKLAADTGTSIDAGVKTVADEIAGLRAAYDASILAQQAADLKLAVALEALNTLGLSETSLEQLLRGQTGAAPGDFAAALGVSDDTITALQDAIGWTDAELQALSDALNLKVSDQIYETLGKSLGAPSELMTQFGVSLGAPATLIESLANGLGVSPIQMLALNESLGLDADTALVLESILGVDAASLAGLSEILGVNPDALAPLSTILGVDMDQVAAIGAAVDLTSAIKTAVASMNADVDWAPQASAVAAAINAGIDLVGPAASAASLLSGAVSLRDGVVETLGQSLGVSTLLTDYLGQSLGLSETAKTTLGEFLDAVATAPQTAYSKLVDNTYQSALGRAADEPGKAYWLNALYTGAETTSSFMTDFLRAAVNGSDAIDKERATQYARSLGIPGFAVGGMHAGGLRLVGEAGPELEVTGPSRIYSAEQTRSLLSGGGNAEVVAELRALRSALDKANTELTRQSAELAELKSSNNSMHKNIAGIAAGAIAVKTEVV